MNVPVATFLLLQLLPLISIFPFVFPEFVYCCYKEDRSVSEEHACD